MAPRYIITYTPNSTEEQRQDIVYAVLENEGKILHDDENEIPATEGLRVEFPSAQDEVIPAIKKYEHVKDVQQSNS